MSNLHTANSAELQRQSPRIRAVELKGKEYILQYVSYWYLPGRNVASSSSSSASSNPPDVHLKRRVLTGTGASPPPMLQLQLLILLPTRLRRLAVILSYTKDITTHNTITHILLEPALPMLIKTQLLLYARIQTLSSRNKS